MQKEKKKVGVQIALTVCVATLASASYLASLFSGPELYLEDLLFHVQPLHEDIVIVAIDDESISRIGQWPWRREVYATMLENLKEDPPHVLGLDVIFAEESLYGESDDHILAEILRDITYPVVLPVETSRLYLDAGAVPLARNVLLPQEEFFKGENVTVGSVNLIADRDGVIRRFPKKVQDPETSTLYESFGTNVLTQAGYDVRAQAGDIIERIVYSAPPGTIRKIPFWRVYEGEVSVLRDKIVLVGATAADLHDDKPTPLMQGEEMAGVEIHATIVSMLLRGQSLREVSDTSMVGTLFVVSGISLASFLWTRRMRTTIVLNILFTLLYVSGVVILFAGGTIVNLVHVLLASILTPIVLFLFTYFVGERERRHIKQVFSKYVSKDVLDDILEHPETVTLGGEEREITLLFSDIRGFTTLSESTQPTKLVAILNRYFSAMTRNILNEGGVLDKYIGDAIMAFWGAPLSSPEQADHALSAALGMLTSLDALNVALKEEGISEIHIGIGIYTGPAVVGNIGSEHRFDYTAIGDTVNTAARFESLTKEKQVEIIFGERTKQKLKKEYPIVSLGTTLVKGKAEELQIYTLDRNKLHR